MKTERKAESVAGGALAPAAGRLCKRAGSTTRRQAPLVEATARCHTADELLGYHGTSAVFEAGIRQQGLKSFRMSGGVYFSPFRDRALAYAQCWALAMRAVGRTPEAIGIVVAFAMDPEAEVIQVQLSDLLLPGRVAPERIRAIERVVCDGMDPAEQAARLFDFLGIVSTDMDRYGAEAQRLLALQEKIKRVVDSIPWALIQQGVLTTSAL